ncbi:MAG: imidazole glycerol phosphate synthase subunit HisH [Dehalococcoidia bacterium]|nr:imidazole glycerol phosphate synthase subunit HisH [Dehalococcoidia bacterium]
MKPKIVIIDYGAGNLRSVARAVAHVGFEPTVTADPHDVQDAAAVILPGVGAAADTMRNLRLRRMAEPVKEYIASGRPFFGVCMGQQALLSVSEEGGEHECLGVIEGRVRRLPAGQKVPHMGWNQVRQTSPHPIFEGIPDDSYFYFVHSYAPEPVDHSVVIGETAYGRTFASVLARDNVIATQFHPEKSAAMGLRMYANFLSQVA